MNAQTATRIDETLQYLNHNVLQGKQEALRLAMVAMLTGGHLLIEDLPGLGKTTLALALAGSTGLSLGRVQCTSDLLPSDITGLSIFHREEGRFVFCPARSLIILCWWMRSTGPCPAPRAHCLRRWRNGG